MPKILLTFAIVMCAGCSFYEFKDPTHATEHVVYLPAVSDAQIDVNHARQQLPGQILIDSPSDRTIVSDESIYVRARLFNLSNVSCSNVRVAVNGQLLPGGKAVVAQATPNSECRGFDVFVQLAEGENLISLTAEGTAATASVRINRKALLPIKPNLYVLSIGISQYKDHTLDLKWADQDAAAFEQAFTAQKQRLYGDAQSKLLINEKAQRRDVVRGLEWLARSATQRDVAVILISGHGARDDRGAYFFVPYDAERDDIRGTCLHWALLTETLSGLPCKVVLAMDTCHSGAVTGLNGKGNSDLSDVIKELSSVEAGMVVMSSSTGREQSYEKDEWGHGAFAMALIEGIQGRRFDEKSTIPLPKNPSGVVSIVALDAYVTDRVKELTHGKQHPVTSRGQIPSFPFVVTQP